MNRNQRRMSAFNARKASEAIEQTRFERRIVSTLSSCNQRVEKAVISPSLRDRHESTSVCLPEIAIFNAGYRTVRKDVTHIIK
ncbi:hypothetical protein GQQ22_13410 [Pantoea agglomerans]|uniref:transcriptional antitermination N peptide n=1 Tax=Enterobacter agglomerans TaxID=549 RepID=UPI0013B87FFA|nr:hypothetical protein [Pantoea agglomerans]NEG99718.1 hypothetical protein [Pantoea agglomerans]